MFLGILGGRGKDPSEPTAWSCAKLQNEGAGESLLKFQDMPFSSFKASTSFLSSQWKGITVNDNLPRKKRTWWP